MHMQRNQKNLKPKVEKIDTLVQPQERFYFLFVSVLPDFFYRLNIYFFKVVLNWVLFWLFFSPFLLSFFVYIFILYV